MSAAVVSSELSAIRTRTRRALVLSLIFHAALLFSLALAPGPAPQAQGLIEIAWLDEGAGSAAAARAGKPEPAVESKPAPVAPALHEARARFERDAAEADVSPTPEEVDAVEDRLRTRLASLQSGSQRAEPAIAVLASAAAAGAARSGYGSIGAGSLAGLPAGGSRGSGGGSGSGGDFGLRRSQPAPPPLVLTRAASRPPGPEPALSKLREERPPAKPAAPAKNSNSAKQIMAGMTLKGPVADRPLVDYSAPVYPEWAKKEGVEAAVHLYFEVLPGGQVKENILVEKTSGSEDFDQNAIAALRTWRFEPLAAGATGEQWGLITMNFRLDGAAGD